jgi:hypothetical protein
MTPKSLEPKTSALQSKRPNIVYFLVDYLGMGELSSYTGGALRGATTARIDAFAQDGMMLFNFAPETQCTLSRSALTLRLSSTCVTGSRFESYQGSSAHRHSS